MEIVLEPDRNVAHNQKVYTNDLVRTLIDKGGDATLARVSDKAKLDQVLDASLGARDAGSLLSMVAKTLASRFKNEIIRWALDKKNNADVGTAVKNSGIITNKIIVDEAQSALTDPSKITNLDFLYTNAIKGDSSGAKATALALEAPSDGSTARFAHFLAQLVPDASLAAIWEDFLRQIKATGGFAAVADQSKLPGAGEIPLNYELAHPQSSARDQIVKLLIEKDGGNWSKSLSRLVSVKNLPNFLQAIAEEEEGNFIAGFEAVLGIPALKEAVLDWALANRHLKIGALPPKFSVGQWLHDEKVIPAQVVVDEAAKGPAGVNIAKLEFLFSLFLKDIKSATQLAAQTKVGTKDKFANFLAKLPASPKILDIWNKFFEKLGPAGREADVVAQINLGATDAPPRPSPFAEMVGDRTLLRDDGSLEAIVRLMVEKGDQATLDTADDEAKLHRVFTAFLAEPEKLKEIFLKVDPLFKPYIVKWAKKYQDYKAVVDAFRGANPIDFTTIVDEAAKGDGKSDLELLELLLRTKVTDHASAAQLAQAPPTGGGQDKFVNFLAKLPVRISTMKLWNTFFSNLAKDGHEADVAEQINLGAREIPRRMTPFEEMLNNKRNVADSPTRLKEMLSLMVDKGDGMTVRSILDKNSMDKVLNALLEDDVLKPRSLEKAFAYMDDSLFDDMVSWAMKHRNRSVDGVNLLEVMRRSGRITDLQLKKEVALVADSDWPKVLFYVQVLAHDGKSAEKVKDINFGQTLLHNLIVKKAQTPESVAALKHFLSFLNPSDWAKVRDNAAGLLNKKAAEIINAKTHPDATKLQGSDAAPIKDALLIFETPSSQPQPNPPKALPIGRDAP